MTMSCLHFANMAGNYPANDPTVNYGHPSQSSGPFPVNLLHWTDQLFPCMVKCVRRTSISREQNPATIAPELVDRLHHYFLHYNMTFQTIRILYGNTLMYAIVNYMINSICIAPHYYVTCSQ